MVTKNRCNFSRHPLNKRKSAEPKGGVINDSLIIHSNYDSTGCEFKTSHPREYRDMCIHLDHEHRALGWGGPERTGPRPPPWVPLLKNPIMVAVSFLPV